MKTEETTPEYKKEETEWKVHAGQVLRALREVAGLTVPQMCEKLHRKIYWYEKLEQGEGSLYQTFRTLRFFKADANLLNTELFRATLPKAQQEALSVAEADLLAKSAEYAKTAEGKAERIAQLIREGKKDEAVALLQG